MKEGIEVVASEEINKRISGFKPNKFKNKRDTNRTK